MRPVNFTRHEILFLLLLISLCMLSMSTVFCSHNNIPSERSLMAPEEHDFLPSETIIAFDLHSVIFFPDWKEIASLLWRSDCKLRLLKNAFNVRLMAASFYLLLHNPTDEEFFAIFRKRCPELLQFMTNLMNAHKPGQECVALLHTLRDSGYRLDIISNIGPSRFAALQEKYSAIINLFQFSKINSGNADALVKKPDPLFFAEYLRDAGVDGKRIIFVDDNKRNIASAASLGIKSIHFKSARRLKADLEKLGIAC